MSGYVVGIDGGGTRTRGVLLDADGAPLARIEGPPAVADAAHPTVASSAVQQVVKELVTVAGSGEPSVPVSFVYAGLSGAGREAARSAVELELSRSAVAERVRVDTDVAVAFYDVFGDGPGILLVSGTGSIAWGRSEDGRIGRVGGWGQYIGDEGSGYAVGLEALRRVAKQADGRAPETSLEQGVVAHLGVDGVDGLVLWTSEASKAEVAALAQVVAKAAGEGDAVAEDILARAVKELEGHVLTILANLGPWSRPPGLALAGGLLEPGGSLRERLTTAMKRHRMTPLDLVPDGARGAAKMALAARS